MEEQPTPVQPIIEQTPVVAKRPNGFAITSMVLGIVSVLLLLLWPVSIPLAILAIVFGILSLVKKFGGKGMSIAGIATGGATILILVVVFAFIVVAYISTEGSSSDGDSWKDGRSSLFKD